MTLAADDLEGLREEMRKARGGGCKFETDVEWKYRAILWH